MSMYIGTAGRAARYKGARSDAELYVGAGELFPSTLWTPDVDADPLAWWDAADTATITLSGSAVTSWENKGSAGGAATQATSARRPTWSATGLNGLPALSFNNSFLSSAIAVPSTYTIFVVLYAGTTSTHRYITIAGNYDPGGGLLVEINSNFAGYFLTDTNQSSFILPTTTGNVTQMRVAMKDGADVYSYLNGTGGQAATSLNAGDGISSLDIGYAGGTDTNFQGYIQEIIVLPYAADTTTRQKIEGYLAWKWAQQANLPAGHPNKTAAPTVSADSYDHAQSHVILMPRRRLIRPDSGWKLAA